MKNMVSTLGRFCVVCLLSAFVVNGTAAYDAVPTGKSAETRSEGKKVGLVELLQRLDAANPWTVERVSEALGVELTFDPRSTKFIVSYMVKQLNYGDGLIVDEVELRQGAETKQMIRLILYLNTKAKCFTHDSLKKMYPDIHDSTLPYNGYSGVFGYDIERPWGLISFEFDGKRPNSNCSNAIVFIPKGME